MFFYITEYVVRIEKIVSEKVERLSRFKGNLKQFVFTFDLSFCLLSERIQDLRIRLQEEENASKNIKQLPML